MSSLSINKEKFNIEALRNLPILEVYRRYVGDPKRIYGNRFTDYSFQRNEKNPSLVGYRSSNRFYDFGSGNGGDVIALVMLVLNCDFKTACQTLSVDFGIPLMNAGPEERALARIASFKAKAKREMEARFRRVEGDAHQTLSSLYRAVNSSLASVKTLQDMEQIGGLYHIQTSLENYLESLRCGSPEERQAALEDARYKGWL